MKAIDKTIFKEYDIRGIYPEQISEEVAESVATAFALSYKIKKIALARDKRPESEKIYWPIIRGLANANCQILDMAIESTPGLYFAVGFHDLDGGIMVTASHNPNGYTGMKLIDKNGLAIGSKTGLKKVYALAQKIINQKQKISKPIKTKPLDIMVDYYKFVFSIIDALKIDNLKMVLDVSGGSSGKIAEYFFLRIPGRLVKMNFRKDKFKDHGLNPMLEENRKGVEKEVRKNKADLGLIWDGDGDRVIFIDEKGKFIEPYYVNCLLCEIILEKIKKLNIKNKTIAIDDRMQLAISETIAAKGGQAMIVRAGYSNLVKAMNQKRAMFGCENSGHYLLNLLLWQGRRNFVFGDGILPALLVIEYLSENKLAFSKAVSKYKKKYLISGEINLKIKSFENFSGKIKRKFAGYKTNEIDGLSAWGSDCFFNVRPSNTEPLVRLNIEAKHKDKLQELKKQLTNLK